MPVYEYRCLKCGHQFEKLQNITDKPESGCEQCGERVTRIFHPVAIHFKGSGFYSTDYGKGRKEAAGKSDGKAGGQPAGEKSGGREKQQEKKTSASTSD
ncbi:MAG: zinc ribbon domain-containing protein [Thermoleophilia bacterium]|nr:zinc ribbon domain-containing protein [Thermoleophilia bacterium]